MRSSVDILAVFECLQNSKANCQQRVRREDETRPLHQLCAGSDVQQDISCTYFHTNSLAAMLQQNPNSTILYAEDRQNAER